MPEVTVEVVQGQCRVNQVLELINRDDVVVYDIDLRSKYAEVAFVGHDGKSATVYLKANEDTLNTEPTSAYTIISFTGTGFGDDWAMPLTSIGRYTLRVAIYRYSWKDAKVVYEREETKERTEVPIRIIQ